MLLESIKLYFCSRYKISTLQDRDKGLAILCRSMCKKAEQEVIILAVYALYNVEIQYCSNRFMWQTGENKNLRVWVWAWNCVTVISEANWGQSGKMYFPFHNLLSVLNTLPLGSARQGEFVVLSRRVNHTAAGRLSAECVQAEAAIMTGGRSGSGIWRPCLSTGPDIDDSSSSLSSK